MKIKSIQKTTLIDFPHHIAASFFCQGCNFNCSFCYNQELIKPNNPPYLYPEEIFTFLEQRKYLLEGIVLTGGEPTMQADLPQFMEEIKKYPLKIKLDTNGYNPDMVQELIDKRLIDYIAMDIKAPLDRYDSIVKIKVDLNKIKESIDIIIKSKIDYEFRTTIWQEFFTLVDIKKIIDLIPGAENYSLQNFHAYTNSKTFTPFKKMELDPLLNQKLKIKKINLKGDWF